MSTWEFNTTTGAGSEIVTVVYSYEADADSTYNEEVTEIWFEGRNVIALLSLEQFKDIEIEAAMRFDSYKVNHKYEAV